MNYQLLAKDISAWLKNYLTENKLDCFIIGCSGGVDSSVVSTLCARSEIPTYAFGLPCVSSQENTANSTIQLNWLKSNFKNVKTSVRDLTDTYITFKDGLNISDLAKANTKSRLRMVFLYSQAATLNGLVVGTGGFQEDYVCHFFTKYGDGGIDISPIGNLLKSEIYGLAKYLGIPQEIQDAQPTDGLWEDNRKDENQLKCSYNEIEEILPHLHLDFINVVLTDRQQEVLNICRNLYHKGKHKSLPIPVFKVDKSKY